jgi:ParB-like chromosome segregation protein Spo0J
MLGKEDLQRLADDISECGQREPVWLYRGEVLDGRNRLAACEIAKVDFESVRFSSVEDRGDYFEDEFSPIEFVCSMNATRRHLTVGQKAIVAARLSREYESEARERKHAGGKLKSKGKTVEIVAERLGVGQASVERAMRVIKAGNEGLVGAVERGMSLQHAGKIAKSILENPEISDLQVGQLLMALDPDQPDRHLTDEIRELFGLSDHTEGSNTLPEESEPESIEEVIEPEPKEISSQEVEDVPEEKSPSVRSGSLADAPAEDQVKAAERICNEKIEEPAPKRDKQESRELTPSDILPLIKQHWSGMSPEEQRAVYEYVTKRCNPTGVSEIKGFDELTEGMAPELRSGLSQWLKYKTERREGYKPTGMASLVRRVQQYATKFPTKYVLKAMEESQAGGWKDFRHYFEGDLLERHRGDIREMKLESRNAVSADEFAAMTKGGD